MRLASLAATLSLLSGVACAEGIEPFQFSSSLEVLGYFNKQSPASDGFLNIGNSVAKVADEQFVVETRLNLRFSSDAGDLVAQPRHLGESRQNGTEAEMSDFYFRQAFGRLKIGTNSTFTAGRNVMAWGPANFRSPSSPFYFDSGKLNPLREVSGLDLARFEYLAGPYSFVAGHVFDGAAANVSDMADASFLKIDYQGSNFLVSGNIAKKHDRKPFFGTYSQLNADDATLLYFEYGRGQRAHALSIDSAQNPPFQRRAPSESRSAMLLGAAYTLLNGQVVSLEYLHNGHGYSAIDEKRYFDVLKQHADLAVNASDPSVRGRSQGVLGLALSGAPSLLGREYLSLLWQSNPQDSSNYWRVTSAFNLQDRGGQISAYYEKNMSERFSFFVSGVRNFGPVASEYKSVVKQVLTVGIKAYLF